MSRQAAIVVVALVLCATPLHAQVTLFTVTTASADVHIAPSTGSRVIGQVLRGRTFEVTRNLGSWVRVEWPDAPNGAAYLHVSWGSMSRSNGAPEGTGDARTTSTPRDAATRVTSEGIPTPTPRATVRPLNAQVPLFTVTSDSANVHKGPSTGSAVIGHAPRGQAFEVMRDLGSWVRVEWPDAPDGVAYVHVTWGKMSGVVGADETGTTSRQRSDPTSPDGDQASNPRSEVRALSLPSHVIGLGGRTSIQVQGFAVTGRVWTHRRVGIQIEAGKSTRASAVTSDRLNTLLIAPSLIYPLPDLVNYYFWLRPYVGGGATVYRSTLDLASGVPTVVKQGLGYQAFGGAEVTWAGLRQVALSVDLRRRRAPQTFNGFESGGFGVSLSAHWYVK